MFGSLSKHTNNIELIQPIFVSDREDSEMGLLGCDNMNFSINGAIERIKKDIDLGVKNFLIFNTTHNKTDDPNWTTFGSHIEKIKIEFQKKIFLMVDVCLCGTRTDGHCCVPDDAAATQKFLQSQASTYLAAGADCVAHSDMQPNTAATLRAITDKKILSYGTKFKSVLYEPFRSIMDSTPSSERWYQLDVLDRATAIQSSTQYANQGADYLLVKPGITSIDLVLPIKQATNKPVGVYQTSGEFLSIQKSEKSQTLLEETRKVFIRSGADFMISYGARELIHCSK